MPFLYEGISLQNGRASNMDSLLMSERTIAGHSSLLAVICDGVGSMQNGAFAASCAAELMNEWFQGLADIEHIELKMRDEVLSVNSIIIQLAKERSLQTASTLTAVLFVDGKYYGVHIGDTRAYSFTEDGSPTLLTVDDVSKDGKLTGCIGRMNTLKLLCIEGETKGKLFLMCSDGLYKRADLLSSGINANLKDTKDMKKLINRLAKNAIENGELDNISLALIIPRTEEIK